MYLYFRFDVVHVAFFMWNRPLLKIGEKIEKGQTGKIIFEALFR